MKRIIAWIRKILRKQMRRKITLYIGDQMVDLNDQSLILFNYIMEEMQNPTIVRNSYSQQITLKGTPRNNKVFGAMFRSDREILRSTTSNVGASFNPAKKTPFAIYNEMNEILESGYAKLDSITTRRGIPEYKVTLYGGLGSFFYSLSYNSDGSKRTLADLHYRGRYIADEGELDFVINKDSVKEAWKRISGDQTASALWDILNFAPAYNGYPTGLFDANKAIVNTWNAHLNIPSGYSDNNGFVLANLPQNYTEWDVKDLRSYLQRPVIKMSAIISAIQESTNNGGFQVDLDPAFFNENNPYYSKTWLTLPIISTLDILIEEGEGSLSPILGTINIPDGGSPSTNYVINLAFKPSISVTGATGNLYLHSIREYWDSEVLRSEEYLNIISYTATAYDSEGNPIQEKNVKVSSTNDSILGHVDQLGVFSSAGAWLGDNVLISFEGVGIHHIILQREIIARASNNAEHDADPNIAFSNPTTYSPVPISAYNHVQVAGSYTYSTSEAARSGRTITKKMLLSSDKTPADYLLSFCKMFGLVFHMDKAEKKITIYQRDSFYNGEILDLTSRISRSDNQITPFVFDSKWYDFNLDYSQGDFAKYYASLYNRPFGSERVNTGYEFNAEVKNLFDKLAFKGAVEILESSKYFVDITDQGFPIPAVFQDAGGSYSLMKNNGESVEFDLPGISTTAVKSWWNETYKTYDIFPKLQFHNKDYSAFDERDTLLFLRGVQNLSSVTDRIAVTDDTALMMALNNNTPCWILDAQVADPSCLVQKLPMFSRYRWSNYGAGIITDSLDFGTPAEVQIPDVTFHVQSSIFSKYWENYISDRYDDDSRVMRCKVNLAGLQVGEDLFRNFYFFGNSYWVLNRIINHSLTTYDDTECEFVKVQDINNYYTD